MPFICKFSFSYFFLDLGKTWYFRQLLVDELELVILAYFGHLPMGKLRLGRSKAVNVIINIII